MSWSGGRGPSADHGSPPGKRMSIGRSPAHGDAVSGFSSSPHGDGSAARIDSGGGDVGHRVGVVGAVLGHVERRRRVEDRLAVLDRDHATRGEAATFTDAVDVEDDRHVRVAGPQEVRVHRMDPAPGVDGAARGHQALRQHLAAEDPLARVLRAQAAEQVDFELLELEEVDQVVDRSAHAAKLLQPSPAFTRRRRSPSRAARGRRS